MRNEIHKDATKFSIPVLRKLSRFVKFSDVEVSALQALIAKTRTVARGTDILREGDRGSLAYVVLDGWAFCYKDVDDGGRQIVNFHMPGDFMGLRSLMLRTSDHSFSTLTECRVVGIPQRAWKELFAAHPRIGNAVLWAAAREEALVVEHLVNIGRRSADERTAHLFCELGLRMVDRGLSLDETITFPIPQVMLADALGLSVVHLNRTLRKLREKGLLETRSTGVFIPSLPRLIDHAGFDSGYLDREPF